MTRFAVRRLTPLAVLVAAAAAGGYATVESPAKGERIELLGGTAAGFGHQLDPVGTPGKTDRIKLVDTTTGMGYKLELFRNRDYPCSASADKDATKPVGYQTFVIATRKGSSRTARRPLWVRMRGGGVGYFNAAGQPVPGRNNKVQESVADLAGYLGEAGLMRLVRDDDAAFRLVSVSMCNHDIYAGGDQADPNNPYKQKDGSPTTVNGLFATKAAVRFAQTRYPTTKTFLHGTSAGGYGTFSVAWGLEREPEGVPLAGSIADAGVLNSAWEQAQVDQEVCSDGRTQEALDAVQARTHPALTSKPANEPPELIRTKRLQTPIMQVWSRGDSNTCGETKMDCPLRDGTTRELGSTDCRQEPVRAAIAAQGPTSKSKSLRLCVNRPGAATPCSKHVVTSVDGIDADRPKMPDYNERIMRWVHQRLAD